MCYKCKKEKKFLKQKIHFFSLTSLSFLCYFSLLKVKNNTKNTKSKNFSKKSQNLQELPTLLLPALAPRPPLMPPPPLVPLLASTNGCDNNNKHNNKAARDFCMIALDSLVQVNVSVRFLPKLNLEQDKISEKYFYKLFITTKS